MEAKVGEGPVRIFLADDAAGVRSQLEAWEAAAPERIEVHTFSTGWQLLRRTEYEPPDLVLLDLTLPGIDGMTVLRHLHDCPAPIVMLTTNTVDGARATVDALLAGAADYLIKKRRRGEERISTTRKRFLQRIGDLSPGANEMPADLIPAPTQVDWWSLGGGAVAAHGDPHPVATPFPESGEWVSVALATTRTIGALARAFAAVPERLAGAMVIGVSQPARFTRALREAVARSWNRVVLELELGEPLRPGQWRLLPGREFLAPVPGDLTGRAWRRLPNRVSDPYAALRQQITLLQTIPPGNLRLYLFDPPDAQIGELLADLRSRGDVVLLHAGALAPGRTPARSDQDESDSARVCAATAAAGADTRGNQGRQR